MTDRFWDKNNKYTKAFLKEYTHWVLEASYRQHTPGSYIIFSKRAGLERISDMTDEESIELKGVMKEIENTLSEMSELQPEKYNYFQMGNALHHLHFHGIPRYSSPRYFLGREWIDSTWGSVPVWVHTDTEEELVEKVRDAILTHLNG